jgi:hypothetical protein
MDLRKHYGASLMLALTLALAPSVALAEKTLWLVRPLYPGQETLVERTEKALDKLMPGESRKDSVIGQKELAASLKAQVVTELPCFSADTRCPDPIDPFVAGLGFDRIVLIQGGQDEAGFKYRVAAYDPKTGKSNPASATNANLEKALLGAIAKVVAAASTLDVRSTPAGATVFIDDVKVGVTPLNTQVLPGERVIRLDLKLHQPLEETIVIPIRGAAAIEKTLEKVAARIVITAAPAGTEISIDGAPVGKDKVDRGIAPGEHVIRLTAENHKAFEQTISVKADQQFSLDKTLEALPGAVVKADPNGNPNGKIAVILKGDPPPPVAAPPPPPKPATIEEQIYERRSYFHANFEMANLTGNNLVARRFDTEGFGRTTTFATPSRTLVGANAEFGTFGKYFGIAVFGISWLTNIDSWAMNVGFEPGQRCEASLNMCLATRINNVKANLVVVRALQPQVRFVVWRFQFGVQVGLEFRSGQVIGEDDPTTTTAPPMGTTRYKDGFVPLDLLLAGRLNVRFFVVDGFFINLQGNYTQFLTGNQATDDSGTTYVSPSSFGFNGGLGYAF